MKLCQFLGLGKTSKPKIMPPMAPRLQKNSECHSSFTFFKQKVMIDTYDHWRACWFKENSYLHPKNSEWCSRHAWWKTLSCDVINTIYLVYFGHQIEFGFAHIMIIPTDWIMTLKSLATVGAIPRAKVITWKGLRLNQKRLKFTGKATAPPPSLVIPATSAPKTLPYENNVKTV